MQVCPKCYKIGYLKVKNKNGRKYYYIEHYEGVENGKLKRRYCYIEKQDEWKIPFFNIEIPKKCPFCEFKSKNPRKMAEHIAIVHNWEEFVDEQVQAKLLENKKIVEIVQSLRRELKELRDIVDRRLQVCEYAKCPYCGATINKHKIMSEISELKEKIKRIELQLRDIQFYVPL